MNNTDDLLSKLGQSMPFSVDWQDYERGVLQRLAAAETTRRRNESRRTWRLALSSAVLGAAAMLLVTLCLPGQKPEPQKIVAAVINPIPEVVSAPEKTAAPKQVLYMAAQSGGSSINTSMAAAATNPETASEPFKIRTRSGGTIYFAGFSKSNDTTPGFMAATPGKARQRLN